MKWDTDTRRARRKQFLAALCALDIDDIVYFAPYFVDWALKAVLFRERVLVGSKMARVCIDGHPGAWTGFVQGGVAPTRITSADYTLNVAVAELAKLAETEAQAWAPEAEAPETPAGPSDNDARYALLDAFQKARRAAGGDRG